MPQCESTKALRFSPLHCGWLPVHPILQAKEKAGAAAPKHLGQPKSNALANAKDTGGESELMKKLAGRRRQVTEESDDDWS